MGSAYIARQLRSLADSFEVTVGTSAHDMGKEIKKTIRSLMELGPRRSVWKSPTQ